MKNITLLSFFIFFIFINRVNAADNNSERKPAGTRESTSITTPSTLEKSEWNVTGLLDVYYSYNFNTPVNLTIPSSTAAALPEPQNGNHNFDLYHNQLALNLVEFSIERKSKEVGLKVDLDFGEAADFIHRYSDASPGTGKVVDEVSKHIGQAILSYSPHSRLTLNFGKMATHLGFEVTKARDNWQYSRPFLFALAMPYWHTGMNINYKITPDLLGATVYLYNGWNSIYDNNQSKTIGFQLGLTPKEGLAIYYNLIAGAEKPNNNADLKVIHEINMTAPLSSKLSIAADLSIGSSANESLTNGSTGTANWYVGTFAFKYAANENYYFSPRFEIYRDEGGLTTGVTQTLSDITLTNSFKVARELEFRAELRGDFSSNAVFTGSGAASKTQYTATASLIYSL